VQGSKGPRLKESKGPRVQGCNAPRIQRSKGPRLQASKAPKVQGSKGPRVQGCKGARVQGCNAPRIQRSKGPRLQGSKGPRVQGSKAPRVSDVTRLASASAVHAVNGQHGSDDAQIDSGTAKLSGSSKHARASPLKPSWISICLHKTGNISERKWTLQTMRI
jgi:hypothetical protein